jgi:tetratricopeptide (TPR) repeat protein
VHYSVKFFATLHAAMSFFMIPVTASATVATASITHVYIVQPHDYPSDAERVALFEARRILFEKMADDLLKEAQQASTAAEEQAMQWTLITGVLHCVYGNIAPLAIDRHDGKILIKMEIKVNKERLHSVVSKLKSNASARNHVFNFAARIASDLARIKAARDMLARPESHTQAFLNSIAAMLNASEAEITMMAAWYNMTDSGYWILEDNISRPINAMVRSAAIRALELDFNNPGAHALLAYSNAAERNYVAAIKEFGLSVQLDQQFEDAYYGLIWANVRGGNGNIDELIRRVSGIAFDDVRTQELLGYIEESKGNGNAAIAHYEHGIRVAPLYPRTHIHLARVYASQHRIQEAIQEARTGVEASPDYGIGHYHLAKLLQQNGQLEDALREFTVFHNYANNLYIDESLRKDAEAQISRISPTPVPSSRMAQNTSKAWLYAMALCAVASFGIHLLWYTEPL